MATMTAQPIQPIQPGPAAPDGHDVIHLGGETAVVVPTAEYRALRTRLRVLEGAASAETLAEAEDLAALEDWQAREAAGKTRYRPAADVRAELERLGLPAR